MKTRLLKIATLYSQFLNVIVFNGNPDETISGRAYREGFLMGDKKWLKRQILIDKLFFDKDHCKKSHLKDVTFANKILQNGDIL